MVYQIFMGYLMPKSRQSFVTGFLIPANWAAFLVEQKIMLYELNKYFD